MKATGELLFRIVESTEHRLRARSEEEMSVAPAAGKWTGKEILGHLIDSACNNQQKFVRTMQAEQSEFIRYQQDDWVRIQQYNKCPWSDLISLWAWYNRHLAHVIQITPESCLKHKLQIGELGEFTLEFIMTDYVDHLQHHLNQILPHSSRP